MFPNESGAGTRPRQTLTLAQPARAPRWSVLLPVALLHGAALWLLAAQWQRADAPPPPRVPLMLREPARSSEAPPPMPAPRAPALPSVPLIAPPTWSEATESTAEPSSAAAATATNTAERDGATAPAPRAPLRLALPPTPPASGPLRGGERLALPPPNPALVDPRSNTPRPNLSERFAKALGTDETMREESFSDGVTGSAVRVRKGNSCVEHFQSRSEALDPFNANIRAMPRSSRSCK